MTEMNNNMDFNQAYEALRETVAAMEKSDTTIDQSLELYEQACKLLLFCQRKLNETKTKITDINERIAELRDSAEPLFED